MKDVLKPQTMFDEETRKEDKKLKMLDLITDIKQNPPSEKDRGYLTRQLVQVTLPHSDMKNQEVFQSRNGAITLSIRSGFDTEENKHIGLPYGTVPRILMYWLTSEVLRTKSRKIYLGETMSDFMRDIGMNPSKGGVRSDSARLKDQMNRLFRSIITIDVAADKEGRKGKGWQSMQVAEKGALWWDEAEQEIINKKRSKKEQPSLFESYIVLTESFYNMIINSPVPLDKRALSVLKNSSLSLDLYAFAVHKSYTLNYTKNKEQRITWRSFMEQLGANYSDVKDFRKKAIETFGKIQMVYPKFNIEYVRGGFIIKAAPPAIPQKDESKLITEQR